MELGPIPTTDGTCATWRGTYRENVVVRGVKENRVCCGAGADDFYVSEGGGVKLTSRWIGDVLVSPFKREGLLRISQMRLRKDVAEEESLSVDDRPVVGGPLPLRPRGIQRIE
jgi:hypothetical protein